MPSPSRSARPTIPASTSTARLKTFLEWVNELPGQVIPDTGTPCDDVPPVPCEGAGVATGPEQVLRFRQLAVPTRVAFSVGDPIEGDVPLTFSAAALLPAGATAFFCLDLLYEQRWFYRKKLLGPLTAAIAMGPAETLTLTMRNTQRKQFESDTVNEAESSQVDESTVVDKEVLNVTRSSSKTNNWSIDGNANISMEGFGAGISASTSESVTQASSTSAQRSRDATQRSANNLRSLQKVQVREVAEATSETSATRRITNPYRDRSLRLDVYELLKEYCVEFHLVGIRPVLSLEITNLVFDRAFVLASGDFLAEELDDRVLQMELAQALQTVTTLKLQGTDERAESVALDALAMLFSGPSLFHLDGSATGVTINGDLVDPNVPSTSFDDFRQSSALTDAVANKLGVILTTLAFYYRVYNEKVLPTSDGRMAVDLARSLDDALSARWIGVEETQEMANVLDARSFTEVFRRLGGFLTLTSGVLRPLLEPAESEREARQAAERAEFVLQRVIAHLNGRSAYYSERYLWYASRTQLGAVMQFAQRAMAEHMPSVDPSIADSFDASAAFLDRSRVIVPSRRHLTSEEALQLLGALDGQPSKVKLGLLNRTSVRVPLDGLHIEPAPGMCQLPEVPAVAIAGPIHVAVEPTA